MGRKAKPVNRNTFVKFALRRASLRWPPRSEALKRARVERGRYACAMCGGLFASNEVHIDHIIPVVDVQDGFTNWDNYINRLLPEVEGFQILCHRDHEIKTSLEDAMRSNTADIGRAKKAEEAKLEKERKKNEKLLKKLDLIK